MGMKDPLGMRLAIEGSLVEAHRVREGNLEQVIIARGDELQDFSEGCYFGGGQLRKPGQSRTVGNDENFERPDRPKGDECGEMVVGSQEALLASLFLADVIDKQRALV